jgi:hypothetical protein
MPWLLITSLNSPTRHAHATGLCSRVKSAPHVHCWSVFRHCAISFQHQVVGNPVQESRISVCHVACPQVFANYRVTTAPFAWVNMALDNDCTGLKAPVSMCRSPAGLSDIVATIPLREPNGTQVWCSNLGSRRVPFVAMFMYPGCNNNAYN